jgi:hypothetical protein
LHRDIINHEDVLIVEHFFRLEVWVSGAQERNPKQTFTTSTFLAKELTQLSMCRPNVVTITPWSLPSLWIWGSWPLEIAFESDRGVAVPERGSDELKTKCRLVFVVGVDWICDGADRSKLDGVVGPGEAL